MEKINRLQRLKIKDDARNKMSTVSIAACGHKGHSLWSLTSYFLCN